MFNSPRLGENLPGQKRVAKMNPYKLASQGMATSFSTLYDMLQNNSQSPGMVEDSIRQYMNPYTDEVIGNATDDIQRQVDQQQVANAGSAAAAGAFGGGRHGLVEAETNKAGIDAVSDMSSQLRSQSYNDAVNFGLNSTQQQFDRQANIAKMLGGAADQALTTGRTINADQAGQGQTSRNVMQQILSAAQGGFNSYIGSPANAVNSRLAALGIMPGGNTGTTTSTQNPGMLDWLALSSGVAGNAVNYNPISIGGTSWGGGGGGGGGGGFSAPNWTTLY